MINNSEFAARLTTIMNYYHLSASAFADKIQVPRSSISHLLSGRNKPSLDFVLKVVKKFEDVELYWLLNGKGAFPTSTPPTGMKVKNEDSTVQAIIENKKTVNTSGKELERIVFFYTDGTFKEFNK